MSKKKKSYSPEEKVKILRRHLVDQVPVSDLCDEYGMNPVTFYRWQKQFFENGAAAFDKKPDSKIRKLNSEISKQSEKLAEKDEVIAEIMREHVKLKKNLGLS